MSTFSDGSVYEKLGVRPFINLAGSLTYFGGFVPSPAVETAMNEANRQYSHMSDLTDRAGEFVADALGANYLQLEDLQPDNLAQAVRQELPGSSEPVASP